MQGVLRHWDAEVGPKTQMTRCLPDGGLRGLIFGGAGEIHGPENQMGVALAGIMSTGPAGSLTGMSGSVRG